MIEQIKNIDNNNDKENENENLLLLNNKKQPLIKEEIKEVKNSNNPDLIPNGEQKK